MGLKASRAVGKLGEVRKLPKLAVFDSLVSLERRWLRVITPAMYVESSSVLPLPPGS